VSNTGGSLKRESMFICISRQWLEIIENGIKIVNIGNVRDNTPPPPLDVSNLNIKLFTILMICSTINFIGLS
jgi:hypothetical protein